MLIDATLKRTAPPLALPTREFMEKAKAIWDELKLPAITPQPPWHGYSLGEWADDWETFARRAVKGEWEAAARKPSPAAAAASRRRPRCAMSRGRRSSCL